MPKRSALLQPAPKKATAMEQAVKDYIDSLDLERSMSANTRDSYGRDLQAFARWLEERGVKDPARLDSDLIRDFLAIQKKQGRAASTVSRRMSSIRGFCRYLAQNRILAADVGAHLRAARGQRPFPDALSEAEMDKLLRLPDTSTALGIRDKAMLEICYGCALRVSELVELTLHDIDF
ncbi:MAG: site-specific integrase, partial [Firmicutes bacterium]|nr:site-specific integrase [Bacillota bacterium]